MYFVDMFSLDEYMQNRYMIWSRRMDCSEGIDEEGLARLIGRFYAKVRADELIGPVFNDAIDDWPEHLEKLTAFWSSLMLTTGRYKGTPMAAHLKHRARLTPAMFERWLGLWRETTAEEMPPQAAAAMQVKANRIAESFKLALMLKLDPAPVPAA